jgi:ABC-type glycerol-3-phosphate transport system permease component
MRTLEKAGLYLIYLGLCVFIVTPFLYMLWASVQSDQEILMKPMSLIPKRFTLDNFVFLFTGRVPEYYQEVSRVRGLISEDVRLVIPALGNSMLVAVAVAAVNVVLAAPAAFAFSRFEFRGKQVLYNSVLVSRLLPPMAIAIPYFVILNTMGLINTRTGIVLAHLTMTMPFVMWYLVTYFHSIPRVTEEAAVIDGCTPLQALILVLVPIARPGLIAAGVFAFMFSYSEFLFSLFISQSWTTRTMPVAVALFSQNPDVSYALLAAAIVVALAVPVAFALIMQRYITQALSTLYR